MFRFHHKTKHQGTDISSSLDIVSDAIKTWQASDHVLVDHSSGKVMKINRGVKPNLKEMLVDISLQPLRPVCNSILNVKK